MGHAVAGGRVTGDRISAAICVYLLMGFLWAYVYGLIESLSPGSFKLLPVEIQPGEGALVASFPGREFSQLVYFSFVTITTLGYGDITPANPLTRVLTTVEALMGQIYLVVLVARLVGLHIAHSHEK